MLYIIQNTYMNYFTYRTDINIQTMSRWFTRRYREEHCLPVFLKPDSRW